VLFSRKTSAFDIPLVSPLLITALLLTIFAPTASAHDVQQIKQQPPPALTKKTAVPSAATAAPKIAFGSSRNNGNHDIFVMDPDGSNEVRLTTSLAYDDQPAWSPDGTKIAFMSGRDGNFEIYSMTSTGAAQTRLTNNPQGDGFPAWSPDGSRIAFVRGNLNSPSTFEIYVMDATGGNEVRLTNDSVIDGVPSWSPDGTKIVFMSGGSSVFDPNSFEIYTINADGSNRTRLTNNSIVDGQPSYSPDGTKIVFASGDAMNPNGIEIYVMSANGTNVTRLTNNSVTDAFPTWSQDGTRIVFASGSVNDETSSELFIMNADGSNQARLTNNSVLDWFPDWQPLPGSASQIQFSAPAYNTTEGAGSVSFTVTRTGATNAPASVRYNSADTASTDCSVTNGLASERCDYETVGGLMNFAPGETSKTVSILLVDDAFAEGSEVFNVALSLASGSGTTLGAPTTATITIADNDSVTGSNPLDNPNAEFFVQQQYIDFLNRLPDAPGFAFWTNQITSCGSDTQCIEIRRINVSAAFFLSIEFQETGYLVYRLYKIAYNPPGMPVPIRYAEFMADTQEISKGVIVGQAGWEQQLEANKQAYLAEFVLTLRFTSNFATSLTPTQFVDKLYANAGVMPSDSERASVIAEFGTATNTSDNGARVRVLRRVADNSALKQQETNKAFVLMQYFGYLRRNPFDPPEPTLNYDGYNFWLNKLNQFNGNFVNAEMVKAFLISGEYRQRFGHP